MIQYAVLNWGTKENIYNLVKEYEGAFPNGDAARIWAQRYQIRLEGMARYIEKLPADQKGFGQLTDLMDSDAFIKNCENGTLDILAEFKDEFTPSNFAKLSEGLSDSVRQSAGETADLLSKLYSDYGYEGIIEFYTDNLGISAETLMQDHGLFWNFSMTIDDIRKDLGLERISSQNHLRSLMEESGFSCGSQLDDCWDGDIASEFTEGPAGDLAGQMIDAGVLDAEDSVAAFLLEDIIGIIVA